MGSGYTRQLRDGAADAGDLIGYFGLGFLSALVISERTEVWTTSFQSPGEGHLFSTRTGEKYTLKPHETRPVGSVVRLHLKPDYIHLAQADVLEPILKRYFCLLKLPVYFQSNDTPVNDAPPPWRSDATGARPGASHSTLLAGSSRSSNRSAPSTSTATARKKQP